MKARLYHNPRCSKSRSTLALLTEKGVDFEVKEYLKNDLQPSEIKELSSKLALPVRDILRSGEAPFKELGLADQSLTEDQLIHAIVDNPILLQRPILLTDSGARIGRPPEQVLEVCDLD
ncbi:MAG: arsenate reductase (glutaredoxin) [Pseudomonadota bacterium]